MVLLSFFFFFFQNDIGNFEKVHKQLNFGLGCCSLESERTNNVS